MRLACIKRNPSKVPSATSTPITSNKSEKSGGEKKFNQPESIVDQSLRLILEVVKDLDSAMVIDVKGIGLLNLQKKNQIKFKRVVTHVNH